MGPLTRALQSKGAAVASLALLAGCAQSLADPTRVDVPVIDRVLTTGKTEISGWLSFAGEIKIFDSPEARDLNLVYPYSVCGVMAQGTGMSQGQERPPYGQRVHARFERFEWDTLPHEPGDLPTRRVLDGQIVSNGCWGKYVLLITQLEVEDAS